MLKIQRGKHGAHSIPMVGCCIVTTFKAIFKYKLKEKWNYLYKESH